MFAIDDTIVAIATPPGRGGIGVVRLSGPDAIAIAQQLITHRERLEPRRATFTRVRLKPDTTEETRSSPTGETIPDRAQEASAQVVSGFSRTVTDTIDHVVVTCFPAPASYTGDDVVELSAHGSPVVLRAIVTAAVGRGARPAEPGEFTLRAFLNGRIDLTQAEAVADLIDAATPLQARAAFDQLNGTLTRTIAAIDAALFDLIARLEASVDFPEEGYHFVEPGALAHAIDELSARTTTLLASARQGRLIREGLQVAIVGAPNVGKSSLFNALAGASRAIVTDVPGTTRDLVTEVVDLDGLRVTLVDTAGLRDTSDPVEAEGVERSRQAIAVADLILQVVDASREDTSQAIDTKQLIVSNKADLPSAKKTPGAVFVSALTGAGLDDLRRRIVAALDVDLLRDRPEITNVRHIALVQRAHDALGRARAAALADGGSLSEEFVLADLQDARAALEEISGRRAPEDLLAHIFERFCIGK
jgi:tRNA modification GTPase